MATKPSPAASRGQDADRGRDLKALEQRRLKAARLFAHGTCQAKVARALGVSAQTASRWHARWQQGGTRALRAPPARAARPSSPRPAPPARTDPTHWPAIKHTVSVWTCGPSGSLSGFDAGAAA